MLDAGYSILDLILLSNYKRLASRIEKRGRYET